MIKFDGEDDGSNEFAENNFVAEKTAGLGFVFPWVTEVNYYLFYLLFSQFAIIGYCTLP